MNKKWNILSLKVCLGAALLLISPIFAVSDLHRDKPQSLYANDLFFNHLLNQVHSCVDYNQNIGPKKEVHQLLDQLGDCQYVSQVGKGHFKTKFLLAQQCIEHVLSCSEILGEITNLVGVSHMPIPTPLLCINLGDSSLGDPLDTSIAGNEHQLLTLRPRAQMVRDYLVNGGVLFVTYPKLGFEMISLNQRSYYLSTVEKYSEVLFDTPLDCDSMDPNLMGATYAFKHNNEWYIFSMKASEAPNPDTNSEWALWLGKISQPHILERVNMISNYLLENKGPNIKQFILKSRS
ncbi:MAG: hypothetical protein H0X29_05235 [Parachlamydiaceae bacterium]|nr:hypothetical protein [Parachlamydiaceae bacterium]